MSRPATEPYAEELLAICKMAEGWLRHLLFNIDDDGTIMYINRRTLEDDLARLEAILAKVDQIDNARGKSVTPAPPQSTPTVKPPPPPPG